MSIKFVEFTVPGLVECGSCNCKDIYLCLSSEATVTLLTGKLTMPADITECEVTLKNIGTASGVSCCKTISQAVYYPYTKLTIKYDSALLDDETDEISTSDISCLSPACAVKAAIDLIP